MTFPTVDGLVRGRIDVSGNKVIELGTTEISTDFEIPQNDNSAYNLDIFQSAVSFHAQAATLDFDVIDITFNAGGDSGQWRAQCIIGGNLEWERAINPGETAVTLSVQVDVTAYQGTSQEIKFRLQRATPEFNTLALTLENVGGAVTDFQFRVDHPTLANNEVEFFSDSGLTTTLPWWREDASTWWVKDSIGATTSKTIYAKYGGTTVGGDGNGFNVFEFFDDFNAGSIDPQWDQTTGTPSQAGGILTLDPGDGLFASGYTLPHSVVMQSRARRQVSTGNGSMVNASTTSGTGWVAGGTGVNQCGIGANGATPTMKYAGGSTGMSTPSLPTAEWIKSTVRYRPGDVDTGRYRVDYVEQLGNVWNNKKQATQPAGGTLSPNMYWLLNGYCEFDHYFIRKDSQNGIAVRPPDPVAYWSFDDADISGGQVLDRMGNGLHLDIIGGVTTGVAGQVNQACLTDGSTGYFRHDGDPLLSFDDADDAWSVDGWFKSVNNIITFDTHMHLLESGVLAQLSTGYVYHGIFNWNETANRYIRSEIINTVNDNNWHHVLVTKGTDESASAMEIYIDGVLDLKVFLSDDQAGSIVAWVKPFLVSAMRWQGQPNDLFIGQAGTFDEMRVFRATLNDQHARWLYQAGLNGIQPW